MGMACVPIQGKRVTQPDRAYVIESYREVGETARDGVVTGIPTSSFLIDPGMSEG